MSCRIQVEVTLVSSGLLDYHSKIMEIIKHSSNNQSYIFCYYYWSNLILKCRLGLTITDYCLQIIKVFNASGNVRKNMKSRVTKITEPSSRLFRRTPTSQTPRHSDEDIFYVDQKGQTPKKWFEWINTNYNAMKEANDLLGEVNVYYKCTEWGRAIGLIFM